MLTAVLAVAVLAAVAEMPVRVLATPEVLAPALVTQAMLAVLQTVLAPLLLAIEGHFIQSMLI